MFFTTDQKPIVAGMRVWYIDSRTDNEAIKVTTVFNSAIDPRALVPCLHDKVFIREEGAYYYRNFVRNMRKQQRNQRLLPVPYSPAKEV
jgi:hypothetical protein